MMLNCPTVPDINAVRIGDRLFARSKIQDFIKGEVFNPTNLKESMYVEITEQDCNYIYSVLQPIKEEEKSISRKEVEKGRIYEQESARQEILGQLKGKFKSTNEILKEREKTHGNFADHAYITDCIKKIMRSQDSYHQRLTSTMREALDMNAHKIGRILAGDPFVKDHWADIAGYAELIARELPPPA